MSPIALVLAGLAAVVHIGFFYLESIAFTKPAVHRIFGVSDAAAVEVLVVPMRNQGFYNLFLALGTLAGVIGTFAGWKPQGPTLVIFGCLFMIGAALVLIGSRRSMWRGALIQGLLPALALIVAALAA
jgi:putative membrane protein